MSDKKKIIVVDDDQDIVDSITMILESAGYDALTADSSDSCRELLKSVKPDLFILDVMMETMTDGYNLGFEIKSDAELKSIPIIIVSSIEKHTGFPVDKEYIQADEFLEKPLQPKVLLESIKKYIR